MTDDPLALDLNVDAALLLRELTEIDAYPAVLALMPNIFRGEDRERVRAVLTPQLAAIGVVDDHDQVHPVVRAWLQCLDRPDIELAARVIDFDDAGKPAAMLRFSLTRRGPMHVLALRNDDHVVIQPVFTDGERLDPMAAAIAAVLGVARTAAFDPLTAASEDFSAVPAEPEQRRRALFALGASSHTAAVLTRALDGIVRRAEVVMIEHTDGVSTTPELCLSVLDTVEGRLVVVPATALDGQTRSTYLPGDEAALRAGVRALVELLPGGSWFDHSRN
ncbi:ESX secretion-associated protein EspG [Nocardia tengchongensis]|uniref:ESX secretion-associated protein EspG n=1 Tax=Nocardia tengchongensis TaxID=2055889 RepID=UPI0036BE05F5